MTLSCINPSLFLPLWQSLCFRHQQQRWSSCTPSTPAWIPTQGYQIHRMQHSLWNLLENSPLQKKLKTKGKQVKTHTPPPPPPPPLFILPELSCHFNSHSQTLYPLKMMIVSVQKVPRSFLTSSRAVKGLFKKIDLQVSMHLIKLKCRFQCWQKL